MESYRIQAEKKSLLVFKPGRWWIYIFIILALSFGKNMLI